VFPSGEIESIILAKSRGPRPRKGNAVADLGLGKQVFRGVLIYENSRTPSHTCSWEMVRSTFAVDT
jgi:hypothetical protein